MRTSSGWSGQAAVVIQAVVCPGGGAALQDQQVGDGIGAGHGGVRAGGQPDGGDQVGQVGDLAAGGVVAGIQGVAAGEHRDQAAGAVRGQRLDDEVVVDRMPTGVVVRVGQRHLRERDVAHHRVEESGGRRVSANDSARSAAGCSRPAIAAVEGRVRRQSTPRWRGRWR